MSTENTSLKIVSQAVDSNISDDMVVGENSTYQRQFVIVAGSLLTLLVLLALADKSGGQHLKFIRT